MLLSDSIYFIKIYSSCIFSRHLSKCITEKYLQKGSKQRTYLKIINNLI